MIAEIHLQSAKSAIERLTAAHNRLGTKDLEIPSELCRLEQVAGMTISICHSVKALAEEAGIRIASIALSISSQQASAVRVWVDQVRIEQARKDRKPKAEIVMLLSDLREDYLEPVLQLFTEITKQAEERYQHQTRLTRPEPHKIPAQEEE